MTEDLVTWMRQLHAILDATAEVARVLGIATNAVGLSGSVHAMAASDAEDAMPKIARLVRETNALAERIVAADPTQSAIVLPLITVPGEKAEVDLRPWWSRLLDKVSSTARRNTAAEGLETLRLETDAALTRAAVLNRS